MRLDRFLCENKLGTRSEVKNIIKKNTILVNGNIVKDSGFKVDENLDQISFNGKSLKYEKYHYYVFNKPKGYVTANHDKDNNTIFDILDFDSKTYFAIGRLDKDTTGLLLITNDGKYSHNISSPSNHINKTYEVELRENISKDDIEKLEQGIKIEKDYITKPAKVKKINEKVIELSIQEGKFHQVKRMIFGIDNEVMNLKRVSIGDFLLPKDLDEGSYRELTEEEKNIILGAKNESM